MMAPDNNIESDRRKDNRDHDRRHVSNGQDATGRRISAKVAGAIVAHFHTLYRASADHSDISAIAVDRLTDRSKMQCPARHMCVAGHGPGFGVTLP
ncbi:hypothetical protein [Bradyrhizobium sp.]|uniref:hypothetical protein n=1 Tax=Bradyrhizobium sp. TaxID=376 RepID=UPI002732B809|nr:hypothetical protein [Bradyrhizobium sp.]MDP3074919.1 hypothetical protein [Bradyrhizobium sp.]